jgi:Kef-type K+ transport system membrane component KefB
MFGSPPWLHFEDPVVELLLILFFMFVAAQLLGRLVERWGQPSVVGEITAGILIGPSVIGMIDPADPEYGLALHALAEIGIVILLFSVGLETRLGDLRKVGKAAMEVAILGVVVPLIAGFALLLALGQNWHAALFVGAAMVATSVGITARVLADMRKSNTKTAKVILGAAVIDDILGMIVLAIVTAVAGGGESKSIIDIAFVIIEALAFVGVALYLGPRVVGRIAGQRPLLGGKLLYDRRRDLLKPVETREQALVLAIAACLGLAAASAFVSLAPIIGAFLAGVAFADVESRYELHQHLQPVRTFLVPFFFVVMGSQVVLNDFVVNPGLVVLALVVTVVAAVTKYYPTRFGARSMGKDAAKAVGIGMMPRGEVGLIIGAIAFGHGVIESDLFSVVVFMSLGTSLIAPPLLRNAMSRGKHERVDPRVEIAKPHEWKPPADLEGPGKTGDGDNGDNGD